MVRKPTISKFDAYQLAKKAGAVFSKDYYQQRSGVQNEIAALAKLAGYRKPASASGSTSMYFFEHLNKIRIKHGWK
jgi:hypothetical protein